MRRLFSVRYSERRAVADTSTRSWNGGGEKEVRNRFKGWW